MTTNIVRPPVRTRATPNVTPFTYYDGATYLEILEALRAWLRNVLVPEFDELAKYVDEEIAAALATVEDTLNAKIAEIDQMIADQNDRVDQEIINLTAYVDNAVQQIINDSIEVQDPVVAGIIRDEGSEARGELDAVISDYVESTASETVQSGLNVVIVGNPKYGDSDPTGVVSSQIAVEAAIADAISRPQGSRIIYVDGVYALTDPILIEQNDVQVIGAGGADQNGTSGTGFIAHADHVGGTMFEVTGARSRVSGLMFRGEERVEIALKVSGWSSLVERTYAHGGTLYGGEIIGNRSSLHNNYWRGVLGGEAAVRFSGADVQIVGDRVRANGTRAGAISSLSGGEWIGGHITGGGDEVEALLEASSGDTVYSNIYFDTVNSGPMIHLIASGTTGGNRFIGCMFYNRSENMVDGAHPVIKLDASAGGAIKNTIITGAYFSFNFSRRPSYIIQSLGNVAGTSFTASNVLTPTPLWNERPATVSGISRSQDTGANSFRFSEMYRSNAFDGTGSQTVFEVDFPGLATHSGALAKAVVACAGSADAAAPFYASYTSNHRVRFTFLSAPPAGTGNVVINWTASL